ncbi:hypothetical protein ABIB95_008781 [Bradyrhizobium sp. LA2.1]
MRLVNRHNPCHPKTGSSEARHSCRGRRTDGPRRGPSSSVPGSAWQVRRDLAHVGMAERQVHLHACRNDDHNAFSFSASCRFTSAGLLPAGAKTRRPSSSSIASSRPAAARDRARPRTPAPHSSRRRRAPPLPVAAPFERSARTGPASGRAGWWRCHSGGGVPNRPNLARLFEDVFSFHFGFSAAVEDLRWRLVVPGRRLTTRTGRTTL